MYKGNYRAQVNPSHLDSFAICDVGGELVNHSELQFQYDYAGTDLINLGYMACRRCYNKPFLPGKVIILPPDPLPIENPRPPSWATQSAQNQYQTNIPLQWDEGLTWDSGLEWDGFTVNNAYTFPNPWGYGY